jgi:hypothetical protein
MPKTTKPVIPDIEVDDPAEAFRRLENFTRQILSVPKKKIDAAISREKRKPGKHR